MTSAPAGIRVRNGPAVAHYPPGATLGPRVLPCFEFVWMLRGRAGWSGGPATHALEPGVLLLARPGVPESYTWDPDRPCAHGFVTFYLDEPGALGSPPREWPSIRRFTAGDPVGALCRYLLRLAGTDDERAPARIADVLGWLTDLFVHGPLTGEDTPLPGHLAPLADHLRRSWRDGPARPPALAEMAAAAGVSPGHLARIFRRRYGAGPVGAVELIRLARAAILLQRSNLTVSAIAEACGFVNPFHFSRRFRATYGVPPREYRAAPPVEPLAPIRRAGLLDLARPLLGEDG
ncbi:hypothetical protein GCM10017786_06430 [Amycolatopsis deserti]|uniref:HTH araC/xylS-type domain-containing protein n=1 Tax=Amycolatopsis deserti TaxID=185696 RepID=A0ABQ3IHQ4_9PSEU|nr:AraC family transcriptional regulator [Amycolatopsis deserti]GHE79311.1 hypothetical protein GCM10017786_06430 [Amycolatopsis deserti]